MSKREVLFHLLNEFFDNIYVISLKRSKDRHSYIKEKLQGLEFEFFWGVDGKEQNYASLEENGLYHPYLTKLMKKRKGLPPRNLALTRIGCALSHVSAYKDILKNNYKNALILEDDLIIDLEAVDAFEKAIEELPDDWQLLYFGHWGANSDPTPILKIQKSILSLLAVVFQKFERLKMIDPEVIRCWFPRSYSENLDQSGTHHGTYAYGVTAEGARTILKYQMPIVQEIDNTVAELCNYEWIKAYNLKERVFYPNLEIPSTINF